MRAINLHWESLVFATVLLLSACAQQAPVEVASLDRSDAQIVTSDPLNSDATCTFSDEPLLVIGEDEEDDKQWFSSIRGVGRLSDGSIVAVDRTSAEVRVYDASGQFLRSMGRSGEGPGEFRDPYVLWVTAGDTLWVGDYRPWRYEVFTAQGDFVRQVSLSPEYLNPASGGGVLDNGYTVNARNTWFLREGSSVPDTLIVEIHDPTGKLVGNVAALPSGTRLQVREGPPNYWVSPLFDARAEVDARGSTIVLTNGSEPEVQVLDQEQNLHTIIRWNEPDRAVTNSHLRAWREDYQERYASDWDQYNDAAVSPERPIADEFPAMSTVMIGRDGRIWVLRYSRPREESGWLAFGSGGEFICHMARLPGEVWEFGADYVLLEGDSDLGAETVRMHSLTTPDARTDIATAP